MPDDGTIWEEVPSHSSPYVDWWWVSRGVFDYDMKEELKIKLYGQVFRGFNLSSGAVDAKAYSNDDQMKPAQSHSISQNFFGDGLYVPLLDSMVNKGWSGDERWISEGLIERLPEVEDDTIVVGVIDTGVPLSHRRTWLSGECGWQSRIISSWQQSADRSGQKCGSDYSGNELLPFGLELTGPEIDRLCQEHTHDGRLDEDAFNRAAQLTDPLNYVGHRDLDFRAAHGAHVLDLASGYDPEDHEVNDLAKRIRLVVVNLPTQALHGTAGHFLQYFASFAVERVRAISFALYTKKFGESRAKDDRRVKGFPTLINLSYGMQAGPKDGHLPFENVVRELIRQREKPMPNKKSRSSKKKDCDHTDDQPELISPMRLSMPVGNNNLARGTARLELPQGEFRWLDWRIVPEDQTSNFIEIWTDALPVSAGPPDPAQFEICLQIPDGRTLKFASPPTIPRAENAGEFTRYAHFAEIPTNAGNGSSFGRVYCVQKKFTTRPHASGIETKRERLQFLIALRPPANLGQDVGARQNAVPLPLAPAGMWRVGIMCHQRAIGVAVHVQSDQALQVQNRTSFASYLDDRNYQRFESTGRLQDSFSYDPLFQGPSEYLEAGQGPVRRAGSSNALGSTRYIRVFSGFRESDGRPADYAATALLEPDFNHERRGSDAAFPTDDGPAHYGILASGARDGSAVAFRGASMASALSTRFVAEAIVSADTTQPGEDVEKRYAFGREWFKRKAEEAEAQPDRNYAPIASAKAGAGRLEFPETYLRHRARRRGVY